MRDEISLWTWTKHTRNRHTATLHGMCIEIVRNPLAKQLGQKPWYVYNNYTCDNCTQAPVCHFTYDPYNTDGDCLAEK